MRYFLFDKMKDLRSEVCGYATLSPGWKHMRRRLEAESVLVLGRKNSAEIRIDGVLTEIKPGRVLLLPEDILHEGNREITQPAAYYWIHFSSGQAMQCLDEQNAASILTDWTKYRAVLADAVLLPEMLDLSDPEPYYRRFTEILAEHANPEFSPLRYRLLLATLLADLTRLTAESLAGNRKSTPRWISETLRVIEENISNPSLSIKGIASGFSLNPDYLARCFRKTMGQPPVAYILERRVQLACGRLRESACPLAQIAEQCGFGSLRQFHHNFKAITGRTPGEYRSGARRIDINAL